MNELIKPMSVARQEFIDKLVNDVNECQLPLFVIEYVLQDMLNVVKTTAQEQYKAEKEQYENQLKEISSNKQE